MYLSGLIAKVVNSLQVEKSCVLCGADSEPSALCMLAKGLPLNCIPGRRQGCHHHMASSAHLQSHLSELRQEDYESEFLKKQKQAREMT